jgi:hypothetical protein
MAAPTTVQITGPGRLRGTIDTTAWPLDSCRAQVLVQLDEGTSLLVPREVLETISINMLGATITLLCGTNREGYHGHRNSANDLGST